MLPGAPRPLNQVDQDKYQIGEYLENGQLIETKRSEAYEQYYKVKFERMCDKQAVDLYKDYLSKVKSEYELKKKKIFSNKSQFSNFSDQLLCLPAKSRARVQMKIDEKQNHDG